MNNLQNSTKDGIILFAKQTGGTSFSSLNIVKKSLSTKKVGHTGTLDSFASGLLVVCVGNLTRLSSYITGFSKTYEAVIEFGKETDTLEWTGEVVKEAKLPFKEDVINAVKQHIGNIMQVPPSFSALHVDGKRASDLVRSGKDVLLPARPVTIFDAAIKDFLLSDDGFVKAAHIECTVSKGTYIRSLARDIGNACGSAAHLVGLRRTAVGNFRLTDAVGFSLLEDFSIQNVYAEIKKSKACEVSLEKQKERNALLEDEIRKNILPMTKKLSCDCGLICATIFSKYEQDFLHGRVLRENMFSFECSKNDLSSKNEIAVFGENEDFFGMIKCAQNGKLGYVFVLSI